MMRELRPIPRLHPHEKIALVTTACIDENIELAQALAPPEVEEP